MFRPTEQFVQSLVTPHEGNRKRLLKRSSVTPSMVSAVAINVTRGAVDAINNGNCSIREAMTEHTGPARRLPGRTESSRGICTVARREGGAA